MRAQTGHGNMDEDAAYAVMAAYEAAFGPPPMPIGWDIATEIAPVLKQFLAKGRPVPGDYKWLTLPDDSLI